MAGLDPPCQQRQSIDPPHQEPGRRQIPNPSSSLKTLRSNNSEINPSSSCHRLSEALVRWRGTCGMCTAALFLVKFLLLQASARSVGANLQRDAGVGSMPNVTNHLDLEGTTKPASFSNPHWPPMKHLMCRDKRPNPHVWQALFELARGELGFPPDRIVANPMDLIAIDSYYKFNAGGMQYGTDRHHFYYLRVLNAGSDHIGHQLKEAATSKNDRPDRIQKYGIRYVDVAGPSVEEFTSISSLLWSSFKGNDIKKRCIVTAVRDPIERFLSAYRDIEYQQTARTTSPPETLPAYARHDPGTAARFEQFATEFLGGPRTAGMFEGYKEHGTHWITRLFSMTGVLWGLARLRDCRGETGAAPALTAYLPSSTRLATAFPALLNVTCPGLPPVGPFAERTAPPHPDPSHFYSAARQVWRDRGNVSRALCAIHCLDYACFDEIPIPALCQEVYSQPSFITKVLGAMTSGKQTMILDSCGRGNFP